MVNFSLRVPPNPISLRVPLGQGESPTSVASRLAAHNGFESVRPFCLDMGLNFQLLVDGHEEALRCLARLGDFPFEAVNKYAIRRNEAGEYSLGAERLNRLVLRRQRIHVCPACLTDDIANSSLEPAIGAYGRTSWLIGPLRTCARHDLALVEIDTSHAERDLLDFTQLVRPAIPHLADLTATAVRRPFSAYEAYLLNRIEHGPEGSSWLDSLEFYVAAKVCEIFGAVALFGRTPDLKSFTDHQWAAAGAAGFEIAKDGEAGVRRFLSTLQRGAGIDLHGLTGPKALFGRIYEWLTDGRRLRAVAPVRELVGRHILETMPLGPGDMLFGKPVHERLVHSVRTASLESGLHPKRLRKILAQAGLVSARETGLLDAHEVFSASAAEPLLKRISDTLSLAEARVYLNVPRVHAQLLVEHGLLTPVVKGERIEPRYARSDLDAFIDKLLVKASPVAEIADGQGNIPFVAKRACCSAIEIIRLILNGELSWVGRLSTVRGFLSVIVSVEEIRDRVRGEDHGGRTLRQVEFDLGIPSAAVKQLVTRGILASRSVLNPVNRCQQTIVTAEEYSRFEREYVSLRNLSRETRTGSRRSMRKLTECGVPFAFDVEEIGAYFFRREDLKG